MESAPQKHNLLHLKEEILKINTHNPSKIILGGDFNYPDISWDDGIGYIDTNPAYGREVNTLFLELLNDFGMEQLVGEPTTCWTSSYLQNLPLLPMLPHFLEFLTMK